MVWFWFFVPPNFLLALKAFRKKKKKTCWKELNWNELIKFGNIYRKKGSRFRM